MKNLAPDQEMEYLKKAWEFIKGVIGWKDSVKATNQTITITGGEYKGGDGGQGGNGGSVHIGWKN